MGEGYLGLDLGTQGLKGVVVDEAGVVRWSAARAYATSSPRAGWNEQDPADWLEAADEVLAGAAASGHRIRGVGLTGQMHTLVAAGANGQPLRPAVLWSDQRAAAYGRALEERYGRDHLLAWTGNLPLSNFTLLRLLWLRDHEPAVYGSIRRAAVAKDWLRAHLTGWWGSDVTDASGTYLLDVGRRTWRSEWMAEMAIDSAWWGPVVESPTPVGELTRAPDTLRGVPVVAGAGDQEASAVGSGLGEGDLGLSVGTSGVLFWEVEAYRLPPHPSVHVFCHARPGRWHWMAVTQAAAASLRWLRDALFPDRTYAELDAVAAEAPAGSEGLLFFPYLEGERAPILRPQARGAFVGLTGRHTRAHVVRSVLEGVALSLRHCLEAMRSDTAAVRPRRAVLTGGGARSPLWAHILADVLGLEVAVADDPGAAVGAAWLARWGVDGEASPYPLRVRATFSPGPARDLYETMFARYLEVVGALEPPAGG